MISDWTLNWPWALEFGHHWGTGGQVVGETKYDVYRGAYIYSTMRMQGCNPVRACSMMRVHPLAQNLENHILLHLIKQLNTKN